MSSDNTKVVLVDDDPAMLRILSVWLQKAGYQVQTFDDPRKAITSIEETPPDFLITDWEMPHMNGIELCRQVRELKLTQYIYTIFLTVRSTRTEVIEGLEVGADDFLSKPIQRDELLARVRAGARIVDLERRLGVLARTDYLTGLVTQRVFYESLGKEWARVQRSGAPLTCVMMDIDFFKKVNDVHGHPAGDAVLRAVADVFRKNTRANDIPCRYGGEEFCILLPETPEESAAQWAERLRLQISQIKIAAGGTEIQVTASFGVASRSADTRDAAALVDQADQALLCAKQTGRDRVVRFETICDVNGVKEDAAGPLALLSSLTAGQVMSPTVTCLRDDDTVGQAAEFFLRLRINSSYVVDHLGKLAGIVSEKDVLAAMISLDCWEQPLREIMKTKVISYDQHTPAEAIYQFLCRVSIRRVVIVDDSRPVGTISRGTLLRLFRNMVAMRDPTTACGGPSSRPTSLPMDPPRMIATARTLVEQTNTLLHQCQEPPENLEACLVGEATQIQNLLFEVLAYAGANPLVGKP